MSANTVTAVVLGGQPTVLNGVESVGAIAERLSLPANHSVLVNGQNASYDTELNDYDFVSFGSKVEGGLQKEPKQLSMLRLLDAVIA